MTTSLKSIKVRELAFKCKAEPHWNSAHSEKITYVGFSVLSNSIFHSRSPSIRNWCHWLWNLLFSMSFAEITKTSPVILHDLEKVFFLLPLKFSRQKAGYSQWQFLISWLIKSSTFIQGNFYWWLLFCYVLLYFPMPNKLKELMLNELLPEPSNPVSVFPQGSWSPL